MDHSIYDVIHDFIQWMILPVIGSFAYFVRKYITRLEDVEKQVNILNTKTAVIESKLDGIKEGVDELLQRRAKRRKE